MEKKPSTIKNVRYRQFLDKGIIETINEADIIKVLDSIKAARNVTKAMGRSFVILLYYTGARPNELLQLDPSQFKREPNYLSVRVVGSKRGLPRTIYLPINKQLVKELEGYVTSLPPGYKLFYGLANKSIRVRHNKAGQEKVTIDTTDKLRYYFKRWFDVLLEGGIPPYFLRHNRFSKLAEAGADLQDIRMIKGSRTFESVMPYLHMTKKTALKVARKLD